MTPKWGFGVAMLPVGALCFYQAHFGRTCFQNGHFGRISSTLYFTVFWKARVARAVLPPGAVFRAGALALPLCAPKFRPTKTFLMKRKRPRTFRPEFKGCQTFWLVPLLILLGFQLSRNVLSSLVATTML